MKKHLVVAVACFALAGLGLAGCDKGGKGKSNNAGKGSASKSSASKAGGGVAATGQQLLAKVPTEAMVAFAMHRDGLDMVLNLIRQNKELHTELSGYLVQAFGVDFTQIRGVSGAVWFGPGPVVAMVLHMDKNPGNLKGEAFEKVGNVQLVRLPLRGRVPAVAGSFAGGIIIGTPDGVKGMLAAQKKPEPNPMVKELLALEKTATAVLGVDTTNPIAQAGMKQQGLDALKLRRAVVALSAGDLKATARAYGDTAAMQGFVDKAMGELKRTVEKLKEQKEKAKARKDHPEAIAAIMGYHNLRDMISRVKFKKESDGMSASAQFPEFGNASMGGVAVIGMLAAIAVPAFVKYKRRASMARVRAMQQMQQQRAKMKALQGR